MCGATVIGRRHLVTAAHCVDPAKGAMQVSAWVGVSEVSQGVPIQAERRWVHEGFVHVRQPFFLQWDAAILQLVRDIAPGEAELAALASPDYLASVDFEAEGEACGFGHTEEGSTSDELVCATMPLHGQVCRDLEGWANWMLCSVRRAWQAAFGGGDSGGPLYHARNDSVISRPVLLGVISFAPASGTGIFGFANASAILDFVGGIVPDVLTVRGMPDAWLVEEYRQGTGVRAVPAGDRLQLSGATGRRLLAFARLAVLGLVVLGLRSP